MAGDQRSDQRPPFRARLRVDPRFRLEVEQARAHSVPRSIFLGRSWPQAGEPLFLPEDTAAAVALAEEEKDTCPSCGMPRAWCRGRGSKFTDYEVVEETCQASLRLAQFRESDGWKSKHAATQQGTQLAVRFRKDHNPPITAGLDLEEAETVTPPG